MRLLYIGSFVASWLCKKALPNEADPTWLYLMTGKMIDLTAFLSLTEISEIPAHNPS